MRLVKVCSGAQTGADRQGLIEAKFRGIATGGWIPKGCKTEKGSEPELLAEFNLTEHPSPDYKPRTWANVRDSDVTVWFGNTNSPEFYCTRNGCETHHKTCVINPDAEAMLELAMKYETINIAGNRASKNPLVTEKVKMAFELVPSVTEAP